MQYVTAQAVNAVRIYTNPNPLYATYGIYTSPNPPYATYGIYTSPNPTLTIWKLKGFPRAVQLTCMQHVGQPWVKIPTKVKGMVTRVTGLIWIRIRLDMFTNPV